MFSNAVFNPDIQDKLVFTFSTIGIFTLKLGQLLSVSENVHINRPDFPRSVLRAIWHTLTVLPRIRVFFLKALYRGLPVCSVLHAQILANPALCWLHGEVLELVPHMFSLCPHVCAIWFCSFMGIFYMLFQGDLSVNRCKTKKV